MEDPKRGMDSDKKEIPSLGDARVNPKYWTVMVMRSVGKIRSFKISRRLIFWFSIFVIAYLLFSLYLINRYFDLRYRYNLQSKRLESLETDNTQTKKNLIRTKEHVVILEDYIRDIQAPKSRGTTPSEEADTGHETVEKTPEDLYAKKESEEKNSQLVQIDDFVVNGEGTGLSVDFKLVNTKSGDDAMEGYIHIIAMDNKKEPYPEWNHSKDMLKNGRPVNFRRGQPFLIQRFKPYHRSYAMNSNSELPASIMVLVYDRSGSLILEKKYNIHEMS